MQAEIKRVEQAIRDLQLGKMIVLTDDANRENEGDLIFPAEKITPEIMNFMIREGSGIVCLAMSKALLAKLELPLMVAADKNTSFVTTPFTVSIDAKNVSGVSAADRVHTIQLAISDNAKPTDLAKPGHIFPLQAQDDGVFARPGHTEGSIDLMNIAKLKSAAVLCEIMNADGTMARGTQLEEFAAKHNLTLLSVSDIIAYRLAHENFIVDSVQTTLPLEDYGSFIMTVFKEKLKNEEHIILYKEPLDLTLPPLVRIHSACLTGDLFASKRCDCHSELHHALGRISEEGGMLIYLQQEGRGIGLFNKIKAYALQEEHGLDTVQANEELGLPIDSRQYYLAANILRDKQIKNVRLLTNNPDKMNDLLKYGIEQVTMETMPAFDNDHNRHYLQTKKDKLKHTINFNKIAS